MVSEFERHMAAYKRMELYLLGGIFAVLVTSFVYFAIVFM